MNQFPQGISDALRRFAASRDLRTVAGVVRLRALRTLANLSAGFILHGTRLMNRWPFNVVCPVNCFGSLNDRCPRESVEPVPRLLECPVESTGEPPVLRL